MVEIEGRVRISRLGATLVHFEFMGIGRAAAIATVWVSIDENDVDDDSFIDVQSDDSDSSIDSEAAFKALSMQREKPIVKGKNKGSNGAGYSSEEEKWLDAVEEGRLEEKRKKNIKKIGANEAFNFKFNTSEARAKIG
ncbi:hypothetical protein QYM36_008621 [Artemia franciscana]|uniref:Uncharacterized protein n=1 Tax=Artemia franciscana TaxID=6661 RepID=A0AA88L2H7_ARTSF|nr:hypothetical protein QYM36_008621 [Artemia franciscana]